MTDTVLSSMMKIVEEKDTYHKEDLLRDCLLIGNIEQIRRINDQEDTSFYFIWIVTKMGTYLYYINFLDLPDTATRLDYHLANSTMERDPYLLKNPGMTTEPGEGVVKSITWLDVQNLIGDIKATYRGVMHPLELQKRLEEIFEL